MVPADLIGKGNKLKKPLRTVLIKVKIKKRTVIAASFMITAS